MMFFWVALGGAVGTLGRFCLSGVVSNLGGATFPWGTMAVNITGSFIIGFFWTLTGPDGPVLARPELRNFFTIGVCGGYTTFSSFSLQTLNLAQDGEWLLAGSNVVASNVGCLLAVWLGHVCAMGLRR
jgi:CrcB protein